ncbi:ERBB receptor feedback inhibitor 1 [Myripristis murdjan]|uniref:ERBB receptor feedback inhibitor 1-like n=1 Tax=Myripristis murdjan TaxID=586833 RepID=A0A667Y8G7_9TELE|nr:ERBB receptor feedback inhibitor 1-like [Myripristis murdjan]
MAGSQTNYWGQHDMSRVCCGLRTDMENNLTELQQRQAAKECDTTFHLSRSPLCSDTYRLMSHNVPQPYGGDQVVPSSQRLKMFKGHHREAKPLPPLPDPEELMSDEAADSEVEFFTNDRRRLLPKSCPKALCRSSYRGCGQVNYAYQDKPSGRVGGGSSSMAFSWPGTDDSGTNAGLGFGAKSWMLGGAKYGAQGPHFHRADNAQLVRDSSCSKQPEHFQSSRLRYSSSGPADKPEIPPRVPIPPRPPPLPKPVSDDWSVSSNEEDKPPKIPPRVPLVPTCPPRTPSPKSLPLYINGVMPVTQSFAPNPKYVSKALQGQRSERAPSADQCSPCIVPIMKDGRRASATHYFILPCQPAYMDRLERLFREPDRKDSPSMCNPELGCQNR